MGTATDKETSTSPPGGNEIQTNMSTVCRLTPPRGEKRYVFLDPHEKQYGFILEVSKITGGDGSSHLWGWLLPPLPPVEMAPPTSPTCGDGSSHLPITFFADVFQTHRRAQNSPHVCEVRYPSVRIIHGGACGWGHHRGD